MTLPDNVHVSKHPVVASKLSQLRSVNANAKTVRQLVSDLASLLAYEATLTTLTAKPSMSSTTPIGATYDILALSPERTCIVPILRSGLSLVDAFSTLLPDAEIHHLGLFREENTLNAIEYYNKLPHPSTSREHIHTAYVVDPIIATGNTACAAIQILQNWGVQRVVVVSVLASKAGLERVAKEWDKTEIYVGVVDNELNDHGYIVPGLGDIGDRLYSTKY